MTTNRTIVLETALCAAGSSRPPRASVAEDPISGAAAAMPAARRDITLHTQIQSVIVSGYVTQTETQTIVTLITSTNSDGELITKTSTLPVTVAPANSLSSDDGRGDRDGTSAPIGAIVGGVIGGAALILFCAMALFIGSRRGWFKKQPPTGSGSGINERSRYEDYKPVASVPSNHLGGTSTSSPIDTPPSDPRLSMFPAQPLARRPLPEMSNVSAYYEMPVNNRG
ncbi:uncharacterized protein CIMG_07776 [Coccidioides immitis RS]|uniref:Uncharacterized protein n=1 Tax=Coccidioides immitis (strain RS) TaxID=246410 RepID=J3K434_COCIM|nr:uncharacterized protein CIMG_07776 [Coccidioides immitis RS]EAS29030.3 hypothetical protein CIMG_07776 [Coccidioides immitis RS]TPX22807.1 hypothetical protein DIZ76_014686 [Coccidioides immitis]